MGNFKIREWKELKINLGCGEVVKGERRSNIIYFSLLKKKLLLLMFMIF